MRRRRCAADYSSPPPSRPRCGASYPHRPQGPTPYQHTLTSGSHRVGSLCRRGFGGAAHAAVAAWPGRQSAASRILHCPSRQSPSPAREVLCHKRRHRHALVHGRSLEPRSAAPRAVRRGPAGESYFGAHRAVTTAPGPPGPAPLQLGGESELRCIGRLAGEPQASLNWP